MLYIFKSDIPHENQPLLRLIVVEQLLHLFGQIFCCSMHVELRKIEI